MNIKPLHDQILVKVLPNETTTVAGIILTLPKLAPKQGEVLAVGPGLRLNDKLRPMSVKVGDKVIFEKYTGQPVDNDKLLMKEEEILAILN